MSQEPSAAEDSWADLTDEPSRKELFEKIKEASLLEDSKNPPPLQSFAIPKDFFFPDDATYDKILKKPRDKVIFGIDISHHNGNTLNLKMLRLQKVEFVYAKATQGTNFKDPKFKEHWKALKELSPSQRPLRGAYHFLSATSDGKLQAERFVAYLDLCGGLEKTDMPPCMDLEWDVTKTNPDQWSSKSSEQILGSVVTFLKRTEELTGRKPVIYTARSWWLDRKIPEEKFDLLKDYPIWLADYSKSHKASEKPALVNKRTQDIWQFADDAKLLAGYPDKSLDANIFYGTQEQFNQIFKLPPP